MKIRRFNESSMANLKHIGDNIKKILDTTLFLDILDEEGSSSEVYAYDKINYFINKVIEVNNNNEFEIADEFLKDCNVCIKRFDSLRNLISDYKTLSHSFEYSFVTGFDESDNQRLEITLMLTFTF